MIDQRVKALRGEMAKEGIDYYIVPSFDAHQSEYVASHWKSREYISGFNGSAGTVLITKDEALLWTDGRYHPQAESQLKGSSYTLMKQGLSGVPSLAEWIRDNVKPKEVIGFDGVCMAMNTFKELRETLDGKDLTFSTLFDLIDRIWEDRPGIPMERVMELDVKYAGASRLEKLKRIREMMGKLSGEGYLVPNLDDICWILNIRGNDIPFCPFVVSYLYITLDNVYLFVEGSKLPENVKESLEGDGIIVSSYEEVLSFLKGRREKVVLLDPTTSSVALYDSFADSKIIEKGNIATYLKAVKNETEIKHLKHCHNKDNSAMVRFIKWMDENVGSGEISEVYVSTKLKELRAENELNVGPSFNSIVAYGANAAMMHYGATEDNHAIIKPKGLLLVDSGGQYLDGTTDITRTFAVGELSAEERIDYTLTLKSHIGLSTAKFLKGATGPHLDILARKPMWERGIDYKCGTGHGVGFFMSVHEGPHTIRPNNNNVPLVEGMIMTNEPGVYKVGKHGVRIENTVLVTKYMDTEFGEFLQFETISFLPIDTKPLVKEIMTEQEISWLNDYHATTYDKLSPFLNESEKSFLRELTRPI